jgi:hypothetical protein
MKSAQYRRHFVPILNGRKLRGLSLGVACRRRNRSVDQWISRADCPSDWPIDSLTDRSIGCLQVNACLAETQRIGALLSTSAPAVSVSPVLSILLAVDVRIPSPVVSSKLVWRDTNLVLASVADRSTSSASSKSPSFATTGNRLRTSIFVVGIIAVTHLQTTVRFVVDAALDVRW